MEILISIMIFITFFFLIIELIFTLNIFMTTSHLKKVVKLTLKNIQDVDYYRSTGQHQPATKLDYIEEDNFKWVPQLIKNSLARNLKEKVMNYIKEGGISSREKSEEIVNNLLFKEPWFLDYKYEDLQSIIKALRNLYIPIGALCSALIFVTGYTNLNSNIFSPSYEVINKNIFLITFMIKTAGLTLSLGVGAFITSHILGHFLKASHLSSQLSESIFQLKASPIKIEIK